MTVSFFILLVLPLAIILVLAVKYFTIVSVTIPEAAHKVTTGSIDADREARTIPQIIWTYWHDESQPNLITLCQNNWQRFAPDHEIRVIHKNSILEWVSAQAMPAFFDHLPVYRQADWLRLHLLAIYGGIWIDASTVLTRNLQWVHDVLQQDHSEYVGFYVQLYSNNVRQPIIENWFMASAIESRFIQDLKREFDHALNVGEKLYLKEISASGRWAEVIQKLPPNMQEYLIMHIAASRILDRENSCYRLSLYRAEDTAFAFHNLLKWKKNNLHAKLALSPCPKRLPFLVKLRGGERKRIDKYLTRGWYYQGSFLAKYLSL